MVPFPCSLQKHHQLSTGKSPLGEAGSQVGKEARSRANIQPKGTNMTAMVVKILLYHLVKNQSSKIFCLPAFLPVILAVRVPLSATESAPK